MGVGHPSSLQTMCRLSTVVHAFFCVPVSALHRSALFLLCGADLSALLWIRLLTEPLYRSCVKGRGHGLTCRGR